MQFLPLILPGSDPRLRAMVARPGGQTSTGIIILITMACGVSESLTQARRSESLGRESKRTFAATTM